MGSLSNELVEPFNGEVMPALDFSLFLCLTEYSSSHGIESGTGIERNTVFKLLIQRVLEGTTPW